MFTAQNSSVGNSFADEAHRHPPSQLPPRSAEKADPMPPENSADDARRIVDAAIAILAQGEALLRTITLEAYTQRVPPFINGCIGGHYRHCLDHFTSLLRSLDADVVDYDHRERDARIELQPEFALVITQQIRAKLERLSPRTLDAPALVRSEVSYAPGESPVTGSTLGRELVYSIAHAIHHYAFISVMARLMGAKLPEHFGIAPSTVAHQSKEGRR